MIIPFKVQIFTVLQGFKVFRPGFLQSLELRSQTWFLYSHIPLLTPQQVWTLECPQFLSAVGFYRGVSSRTLQVVKSMLVVLMSQTPCGHS